MAGKRKLEKAIIEKKSEVKKVEEVKEKNIRSKSTKLIKTKDTENNSLVGAKRVKIQPKKQDAEVHTNNEQNPDKPSVKTPKKETNRTSKKLKKTIEAETKDITEESVEVHEEDLNEEDVDEYEEEESKTPVVSNSSTSNKKKFVSLPTIPPGTKIVGRVDLDMKTVPTGCIVLHFHGKWGRRLGIVDLTQVDDQANWSNNPFENLKNGQFVKGVVLKTNAEKHRNSNFVEISLRPSLLSMTDTPDVWENEKLDSNRLPKVGELVTGFVTATNPKGCFIRITRNLDARVELKNLSGGFVSSVESEFPFGKLVAGRVVTANEVTNRVELTLRSTIVVGESERRAAWKLLKPGGIVDGVVTRLIDPGLLISLPAFSEITGLCHLNEIFDNMTVGEKKSTEENKQKIRALMKKSFKLGDQVKCIVLFVNDETNKCSLGLKPSYFTSLPLLNAQQEDEEEEMENEPAGNIYQQDDEEDDEEEEEIDASAGPSLTLEEAMKETGVEVESEEEKVEIEEEDADSVSEESEHPHNKKNTRRKEAIKRKAEEILSSLEDRLASDAPPESIEDFERLLISEHENSMIWIQYVAFLVSIGEIEKARAVGNRGLKTISYEKEVEKNNIWGALLSMELQYGTAETTNTFVSRMVKETDQKWAYLTICDAYCALDIPDRMKKAEEALRLAKKATKQESAKVWIRHFKLKFDEKDLNGARKLLKECLRLIPKRKHVKIMSNFARLEFQLGDAERGRTIMEGILENYSKRTDIWNVFIDLEIKYGAVEKVRALFQRVFTLKLAAKKIKSFFKKAVEYEMKHGDEEHVEEIKKQAREYVSALVADDE